MTREEFIILAKAMNTMYPDMKIAKDKETMDVWFAMMGDMDYKTCAAALQVHVNTSPYPPKVVDFRKFAAKSNELNETEAWALVAKAIRKSSYYSEEEFEKLPPAVQKAVGSPINLSSWALLPSNEVHSVVASNFMRAYRAEAERAKTESMIPIGVREAARIEEAAQ